MVARFNLGGMPNRKLGSAIARKSVRIHFLPAPRILAHLVESARCSPAKKLACQPWIGIAGGDIAGSARAEFKPDRMSTCPFVCMDNVQDAVTASGSKIHRE